MFGFTSVLPAELVQLFFVSILVAFSVLVGQTLFDYAHRIDKRVEKKIKNREHPDIQHVLYDILWAPLTLLVAFLLMRIGMLALPSGTVSSALTTVLDTLLFLTLFWFAVRIVRGVFQLADKSSVETETEA